MELSSYVTQHGAVIDLMQHGAHLLKLSARSKAVACMLYHRVVQLQRGDEAIAQDLLGATCLYLAAKICEEPQKIRDVVNVCYRLLHPDEEALEIGDTYWQLRDSVTACELIVLRYLKFNVNFEVPLKYTMFFLTSLKKWNDNLKQWNDSKIAQICWKMCNDACLLPVVVTRPPEFIAAVIVYIALNLTGTDVVKEKEGKQWFEIFVPGTKEKDLQKVGVDILSVYKENEEKT